MPFGPPSQKGAMMAQGFYVLRPHRALFGALLGRRTLALARLRFPSLLSISTTATNVDARERTGPDPASAGPGPGPSPGPSPGSLLGDSPGVSRASPIARGFQEAVPAAAWMTFSEKSVKGVPQTTSAHCQYRAPLVAPEWRRTHTARSPSIRPSIRLSLRPPLHSPLLISSGQMVGH